MSMTAEYLYLGLMGITLFVPLLRSFESRIAYYRSFKALFMSIGLTMLVFIPWDVFFTANGIWGFNPRYLVGISLFGLPVEEWLFFAAVPFSCIFIYRVLNYFFPRSWITDKQAVSLARYFAWLSIGIAVLSWGSWYTFSAFLLLGALFLLHIHVWKTRWLPDFFRAYAVILFPFLIINGVLTGFGIDEEIVWYNDDHNLGIRLFTIPVDDIFYGMALILMNLTWYEYFRGRWNRVG